MIHTPTVLSITQLNTYIKSIFDGDSNLNHAFVSGEISNFTNHYKSGHLYFSLKDEKCVIKCIMFSHSSKKLRFTPNDGMKVLLRGRVSVYEQSGQYQLYVEDMQPDGLGALNLAYEQLKEKLADEGLFQDAHKKSLPLFPKRIGVITSATGAVVHDIQQVLERRYPLAEMVLCPVQVQGADSAKQIINAIQRFHAIDGIDVLIVGRGGGSMEDLWSFNEEGVARAIYASEIPIISAVGHETDITICDFVADKRAPTPSAAAELAVPDQAELLGMIRSYRFSLHQFTKTKIMQLHKQLSQITSSHSFTVPENKIKLEKMKLNTLSNRLHTAMAQKMAHEKDKFTACVGKLNSLSPLSVLARGYAVPLNAKNQVVRSVLNVKTNEELQLQLADGVLYCTVNEVKNHE